MRLGSCNGAGCAECAESQDGRGGMYNMNIYLHCKFYRTGGWVFIEAGAFIMAFTVVILKLLEIWHQ